MIRASFTSVLYLPKKIPKRALYDKSFQGFCKLSSNGETSILTGQNSFPYWVNHTSTSRIRKTVIPRNSCTDAHNVIIHGMFPGICYWSFCYGAYYSHRSIYSRVVWCISKAVSHKVSFLQAQDPLGNIKDLENCIWLHCPVTNTMDAVWPTGELHLDSHHH